MRGKTFAPSNISPTFAHDVGAFRQDSAAEPASPHLLVDLQQIPVPRREKSDIHALTAVRLVLLPTLQGRTGPAVGDVWARVKDVPFTLRRRLQKASSVCFVENHDYSAPASYRPVVTGNLIELQTLNGHGNVDGGHVEGGGVCGVVGEDVLRLTSGKLSGYAGDVVWVGARFAAGYRHSTVG